MFCKVQQKLTCLPHKYGGSLFRSLVISGLALYFLYVFLSNHSCNRSSSELFSSMRFGWDSYTHHNTIASPTNISHIVFGIGGSVKTWKNRRDYIDAWWRPNITRGFVWLERTPTEYFPWPSSSPPFRVSEDIGRFKEYNKHSVPQVIRLVQVIRETFKEVNKDVRWYVMADDDTVLFIENLVEVLAKYDHNKFFYIGENSESISSNSDLAFEMAFGGAGYALSFPLVKTLASNLDECIRRYPTLFGSDHILHSCIADLGVSLTHEQGFHQIDLHRDISGLLSAHPQAPFLSLHHLDLVDPIFPSMSRSQSFKHLMEAAKVDSSRLLQQTICYHKQSNWSFSLSWGYSAQIYEKIFPPSILQRPLQTFIPWRSTARPPFMFNTRPLSNDPYEVPHIFFLESAKQASWTQIITIYSRRSRRMLSTSYSVNHTADFISKIRVVSPTKRLNGVGQRRDCCNIIHVPAKKLIEVRVRACMKDEVVT